KLVINKDMRTDLFSPPN
nr:Chain C1, Nup145N/Nup100/Nup116 R3 [Saccharomyces cerevisiae]7TBI_C2 Chain C2, Nup145N/Nup100/Nup116 R3 [Saccharomyces cerevisiae]7TBI_C3 Chain C3, Nup145N/Nup100/Nup116 R3 [Saccharomyces cerevisiae]7TBI_C4 Chain C4, Nup145N/Nup100/Nup116 R3 [Saccharomyces cerevisiae]